MTDSKRVEYEVVNDAWWDDLPATDAASSEAVDAAWDALAADLPIQARVRKYRPLIEAAIRADVERALLARLGGE